MVVILMCFSNWLSGMDIFIGSLIHHLTYKVHTLNLLFYSSQVNALRLLVNFSCNKENVEHFLTEKILILAKFMDPEIDEDIILRTVVIELNVLLNIDDSLKVIHEYIIIIGVVDIFVMQSGFMFKYYVYG